VVSNDTDADGTIDATSVAIVGQPANGSVLNNGDGTVTYTPQGGFTGTDNFTYTVQDNEGATSNQATVTVAPDNGINAPAVNYPADNGETDSFMPTLSVNNSTALVGAILTYEFEVYSDPELSSQVTAASGVQEGENTTSWQVDLDLNDNTFYYWRAMATDGTEFSPWMDRTTFFVNTANDPPSVPNISAPEDNSEVTALQPALEVTNATDPDYFDTLTYEFEVYADEDMITMLTSEDGVAEGPDGITSWQVDTDLDEETSCWWRARARDDEDEPSDWTDLVSFFVNTANDAPSAPTISSPEDGDDVDTLEPVLAANNSTDADQDLLTYFFEIDKVDTFDSPSLEESGEVQEGAGDTTSWEPSQLDDNTTYYWRVKAWDGMTDSPWVTASFFVDLENDPPVANNDSGMTTEGTAITIDVIDNDEDVDGWVEPVTVTVVTGPENGSVENNGDGTVTYTPGAGFIGTDTFTYTVEDDDGATSNVATVSVTVNDQPTAPTLNSPMNGATVSSTLTPTLSVNNSTDNDSLIYTFELYTEGNLLPESLVASATEKEGQGDITSWTVSTDSRLTGNTTYYWRALADDGNSSSSWMETATFTLGDMVLSLTIPESAGEGDSVLSGTVSVPDVLVDDLEISIDSDDVSEVTVPSEVTIPAGKASATFELTIVDDTEYDDTQAVTVTAYADGWTVGTAAISVADNERSGSKGSSGCFIGTAAGRMLEGERVEVAPATLYVFISVLPMIVTALLLARRLIRGRKPGVLPGSTDLA
jgi:hypothetical protein